MQDDNISSNLETAIQQSLAALTVASQTHKEFLVELLSQVQNTDRAAIEKRYTAIYAQKLQEYFDKMEAIDPAMAARIDYRRPLPPQ